MNGFNVAILMTTFCVLVAGLFAVIVERTDQRDEAADNLARERREHKAETDPLTDSATGTTVQVPLLRVVPAQRDGSEYEWPAIVRAVEGEVSE